MTRKITQNFGIVTDGQRKQIKRILEDGLTCIDFDAIGLLADGAQEIIENGGLVQKEMQAYIVDLLKKHANVDKRFGPAVKDFEFTVPVDYVHDTQLDTFAKKTKKLKTTYYFNDDLTSKNFAKATNKLEPGKTYRVRIFPVLQTVTSDDCMTFLKKQGAILVGGQGITLLQANKSDEFPVSKWTASFDEKDALWKDSDGRHRVPCVDARSDGDFEFDLGNFGLDWDAVNCLLCFSEVVESVK